MHVTEKLWKILQRPDDDDSFHQTKHALFKLFLLCDFDIGLEMI